MKQPTSIPDKGGKILPLVILVALALAGISQAENLEFFEKKYKTKITGVKPIEAYSDPDSYYTAIARKLGIFQLAYDAVFKKCGWKKGDNKTHSAKLTRAEGTGQWEIMVVQFSNDPKTKKPDMSRLEMKLVFIDDDGKVSFPEVPKGNENAEQDVAPALPVQGGAMDGPNEKTYAKLVVVRTKKEGNKIRVTCLNSRLAAFHIRLKP